LTSLEHPSLSVLSPHYYELGNHKHRERYLIDTDASKLTHYLNMAILRASESNLQSPIHRATLSVEEIIVVLDSDQRIRHCITIVERSEKKHRLSELLTGSIKDRLKEVLIVMYQAIELVRWLRERGLIVQMLDRERLSVDEHHRVQVEDWTLVKRVESDNKLDFINAALIDQQYVPTMTALKDAKELRSILD
jgi:hypothetical protein